MSQQLRLFAGAPADCTGTFPPSTITLEGGIIKSIEQAPSGRQPAGMDLDFSDCLVVPGFIDIHVHGGAGCNVMDPDAEAPAAVALHLASSGVTGFLATTVTAPFSELRSALQRIDALRHGRSDASCGAQVLGVHLEGPYINPEKKGAQAPQYVRSPTEGELERELGDLLALVRIVTLAPEMPGAMDLIRSLCSKGILVSLGHSDATAETVLEAVAAGAAHITHCYNAMPPLQGRRPSLIGAAMACPELKAELIWDNIHVDPLSCRALVNAKGAEGVFLISDGIPGAGMPNGYEFSLGDAPVRVVDGAARLPDGTLAGSLLTLDRAFANAAAYSIPHRCAMTSRNAALALGLPKKGLLRAGCDADIAVLAPDGNVRCTIVSGVVVYRAPQ